MTRITRYVAGAPLALLTGGAITYRDCLVQTRKRR